jgi:hypothetical protein
MCAKTIWCRKWQHIFLPQGTTMIPQGYNKVPHGYHKESLRLFTKGYLRDTKRNYDVSQGYQEEL